MSDRKGIVLLGSTGSIGKSTLDVISRHCDRYRVVALTANTDVDALERQCIQWRPAYAAMSDSDAAAVLSGRLSARGVATRVLAGVDGLCELAMLDEADTVVAGIVGAAGLLPALSAVQAGKRILLANKEALVMSGALFLHEVREHGAVLLPVDSEHNAIFQCLPQPDSREPGESLEQRGVNRILLTASGGPFRTRPLDEFETISPQQAVSHPNWVMGQKISIDSATMMNKGLEVIEAHWLFDVELETIEVVIHPQSIIHSLVSYTDGSVLAQMGNPDMRTPIAHALAWPDRIDSGVEPLDLFEVAKLEFEKPDLQRFPCLGLAYEAMRAGGSASITLNAANEIAVEAFLKGQIRFTAIAELIEAILQKQPVTEANTLEEILEIDLEARSLALEHLQRKMTA